MTANTRRNFLRASGVGVIGLSGLPLVAPPAIAATQPTGLRPMYKRGGSSFTQPAELAKASATPTPEIRALRRLSFGYRPEDLDAFMALGSNFDDRLAAYVNQQLNGYQPGYPPTNDPDLIAALNDPVVNFETLGDSLATLWQKYIVAEVSDVKTLYPLFETVYLTISRGVYSRWQLAEILADFWHTHFSISAIDFTEASVTYVHYDRDVIRANMLGNFRQMIEAVTKSTAMMTYLDNASNSKYGPNENFARELQELHTLGAVHSFGFAAEADIPKAQAMAGSNTALPNGLKAGYSESDVRHVTRALTGWTISREWTDGLNTGTYIYLSDWHDTDPKRVLGIDITTSGEQEVQQILDLLAMHPNTARYVCSKLCRRLINDNPPQSIVEKAATVFNDQWQAPDQLKQVVRTILLSDEFKDAAHWGEKVKNPFETVVGVMRSSGLNFKITLPDFENWEDANQPTIHHIISRDMLWVLGDTGHTPFNWPTPDGYPDVKEAWLGSTPLVMSWRFINWLFAGWWYQDGQFQPIDIVPQSKAAFPPNQRSANKLVDYWVNRILGYDAGKPGSPQLDPNRRAELVAFMRQNAPSADTALDLDQTDWHDDPWRAYVPQRLQTLVASIAMLPENLLR